MTLIGTAPVLTARADDPRWAKPHARDEKLSAIGHVVADLVEAMEKAVMVGSHARVRTIMFNKQPLAVNPKNLLDVMQANPAGGYSCWDVSVALVELLRQRGISAGVTATLGAEPGAPSEPHALVRVDDNGTSLLADPYFGIGALRPNSWWNSLTSHASVSAAPWRGMAELVTLEHKAYARKYSYHVLPDTLTPNQLTTMAWQALDYGCLTRHLRGVGDGTIWRLIMRDELGHNTAELRTWEHSITSGAAPVTTLGSYYYLRDHLLDRSATDRQAARKTLFEGTALPVSAWTAASSQP